MKRIKVPAVIYGLIFFLLFAGVVLGSAYQMKTGEGNGVQDYLTNFFEQIKGGADSNAVFKNALKENFICLGIVFPNRLCFFGSCRFKTWVCDRIYGGGICKVFRSKRISGCACDASRNYFDNPGIIVFCIT